MPFRDRVPPAALRQIKAASQGLTGRQAGEAIVTAALAYFNNVEITVLDAGGTGELFRIGIGSPRHGVHGVHVHPVRVHSLTWELIAHKDAVALMSDENFNMYLGLFLQALETGRFRVGFPK